MILRSFTVINLPKTNMRSSTMFDTWKFTLKEVLADDVTIVNITNVDAQVDRDGDMIEPEYTCC